LDPDEVVGGAGGNDGAAAGAAAVGGGETGAGTGEAGTGEGVGEGAAKAGEGAAAKPELRLSPDEIAKLANAMGMNKPAAADAPKPTMEEFERVMKVFKPNKQLIANLRKAIREDVPDEEAFAPIMELVKGAYDQSAMSAAYMLHKAMGDLEPRISAMQAYINERREDELRGRFTEQYPKLKPVMPLVEALAEKLRATGYQGSEQEAFKLVAEQAFAILKTLPGGNGDGGEGASSSRMPTLSGGGQGGAGDRAVAGGKPKSPSGMEVFG
jgi:hypothetical protein